MSHVLPVAAMALLLVSCAAHSTASQSDGKRIRIDVVEPDGAARTVAGYPVAVGLVFPKGTLAAPDGRVTDDRGQTVPHEAEITGWWDADHAHIKWLLLHFRADSHRTYYFEPGARGASPRGNAMAITVGDYIEISTGPLRARIHATSPRLFEQVTLRGKPMLAGGDSPHIIIALADGKTQPGRITQWQAELEHASAARATVKATGLVQRGAGEPLARIDLRYQFFRDETFVRLYHTVTWMVRDPQVGARELTLWIDPAFGDVKSVRVAGDGEELRFTGVDVAAAQDEAEHFAIEGAGLATIEGRHLDGWIAAEGADARGVSVSLRHAWETYPTCLLVRGGRIGVQFWPDTGKPMGFMPRDIMGERIYNHPTWKRFPFSKDAGHFVNNYETSPHFDYTAEGAAWTHELTIGFHDERTQRDAPALNDVTQRPLALRQDPAMAMRVPFMGFNLAPYDPRKLPQVERAVDWLGRLSMARWISENNFGLLRFGMVRWSKHGEYTYYRWMDNTQYDQQMIPWMLFMRGGDRRFFDDGEITSRYCMDMNVNHYNTRDSPTGYMATCGGSMPFANFAFMRWNLKGQKLHFLAYYWHLTGYPRAKDVLDEAIAGAKEYALNEIKERGAHGLVGGRELYNMNRFWAVAYQETFDPQIAAFAANSRHVTINREYNAEKNTWGNPKVYLYNGLVMQDHVFVDPALRAVMVDHLKRSMLDRVGNGMDDPSDIIATGWARDATDDDRFAQIGWDAARGLADLVPEIDLDTQSVPTYPYAYLGNAILRLHMLPMLAGSAAGLRAKIDDAGPLRFADLFMMLTKGESWRGEAFVLAKGASPLRVVVRGHGDEPFDCAVHDAAGKEILQQQLTPGADETLPLPAAGLYRVTLTRKTVGSACVLAAAPVVWHVSPDEMQANESLSGGQHYTPLRLYARATGGPVEYYNRAQRPFAIHDAASDALLLRGRTFTAGEKTARVDAGAMVYIAVRGSRAYGEWKLSGVEPFVSARPQDWFDPREHGWVMP